MSEQEMIRFFIGFIIAFPIGLTIGVSLARWFLEQFD